MFDVSTGQRSQRVDELAVIAVTFVQPERRQRLRGVPQCAGFRARCNQPVNNTAAKWTTKGTGRIQTSGEQVQNSHHVQYSSALKACDFLILYSASSKINVRSSSANMKSARGTTVCARACSSRTRERAVLALCLAGSRSRLLRRLRLLLFLRLARRFCRGLFRQ